MFGQQNKLKELFDKYGWELIETQIPNYYWIAEIWLIKSTWSPTDCYVFISFEVDPQWEDRTRKKDGVWAIIISLEQSQNWQADKINIDIQDKENFQIPIRTKFEKRIPEIFDTLNYLRLKFNNLSS
ncbi:hypothetical protein BH20ACI1_BH20ACI1_01900 [soil metagenome]